MKYVASYVDKKGNLCYHCGLCKITFYDMDVIQIHLSGIPHTRRALHITRGGRVNPFIPGELGHPQEPMKE